MESYSNNALNTFYLWLFGIVYPSSVDYISITMYDDTYIYYIYIVINILGFYYIYERGWERDITCGTPWGRAVVGVDI